MEETPREAILPRPSALAMLKIKGKEKLEWMAGEKEWIRVNLCAPNLIMGAS